jgi:hypothetical protein
VRVPLDLIAAGTLAATAGSAAGVLEDPPELLAAAELVAELELDAVLPPEDEDELLLLPHPTIAAALSSETPRESQLFRVRIALLLNLVSTRRLRAA